MSKGPNGANSKFNGTKYLNLKLTPKDWCSYPGTCKINQVLFDNEKICDKCKYKKLVDIPEILERMNNGVK